MTADAQLGETIRVECDITDYDTGDPQTPASVVITIIDSLEVAKVTAQAMSTDVTGTYYYDYDIAADAETGMWRYSIKATSSDSRIKIHKNDFTVEEAI